MKRFAVEITKGNDEKLVKVTDNKDEAIDFGKQTFDRLAKGDGIVTCFVGNFDESGNRMDMAESIICVWY